MQIILYVDDSISEDEAKDALDKFLEEPWCIKAELKTENCDKCRKCEKTNEIN